MPDSAITITQPQAVQAQGDTLSLKQVTDRVNLVHHVLEKVMMKGTHYGTVPGCGAKMVLLKPGADVLAMTFRLVPRFEVQQNDLGGGHREFSVTCSMHNAEGVLLGQGVGSASTMEKKYRYRKDENGQKIENEDIADVYNTVLKIAKKRAHIDATLTVTGAADLFTQDLIDEDEPQKPPRAPVAAPREKATAPQAAPDGDTVTGVLQDVTIKSGTATNGKPYTRYGLKVNNEFYGTFDEKIADDAKHFKGTMVSLTVKADGKYKTVTAIAPADSTSPDAATAAALDAQVAQES